MSIQESIKARAAAAIERQGDFNETEKGGQGGNYKIPAPGKQKARLIGYTEIGNHIMFQGGQPAPAMFLTFACYGKDSLNEDGSPTLVDTRDIKLSRNERANAIKHFKSMCPKADAHNFIELLGRAFFVTVVHREGKAGPDGKAKVYANLEGPATPAVREVFDDEGDLQGYAEIPCPEAPEELYRLYEWAVPSKEDFDKLSPLAKRKIRSAVNFEGSAIQQLVGNGEDEPTNGGAATDAPPEDYDEQDSPFSDGDKSPATTAEVNEEELPTI